MIEFKGISDAHPMVENRERKDHPTATTPIHELISRRRSIRAFSQQPVEQEKLFNLFEAARWALSSYNQQPWHFVLTTHDDSTAYHRLLSTLSERNASWAQNAPVLLLVVAQRMLDATGSPNKHAWLDVGFAVANLTLQATSLGLFVHQMGGFDAEKARTLFEIPEGYDPVNVIAIGYPDNPDELPPPLRDRQRAPRKRKSADNFVYHGTWANTKQTLQD